MTIRGGGHPKQAMVLTPVSRLGPPPRSFAADAHDCIMVRSLWTYRIQGCGAILRARWQAPLGPFCCPTKKITGARSKSALTENAPYKACSAFTRVAACTLALSPMRDTLIEGFSHFVSSMTAPIASGWSGCRVGLAPTGKRRLVTAHTRSGHGRVLVLAVDPCLNFQPNAPWIVTISREIVAKRPARRRVMSGLLSASQL